MKRHFIPIHHAQKLIKVVKNEVHTYTNPKEGVLVGMSYTLTEIIDILTRNPHKIELSGKRAKKLNHGLCVPYWGEPLYIETIPELLEIYEKNV